MSFLSYTGDVEKINDDCYYFKMANNTKIIHDRYIEVTSPVIDISFTKILGENKNITRCFLNSMIYPNNERIEDIEFITLDNLWWWIINIVVCLIIFVPFVTSMYSVEETWFSWSIFILPKISLIFFFIFNLFKKIITLIHTHTYT